VEGAGNGGEKNPKSPPKRPEGNWGERGGGSARSTPLPHAKLAGGPMPGRGAGHINILPCPKIGGQIQWGREIGLVSHELF